MFHNDRIVYDIVSMNQDIPQGDVLVRIADLLYVRLILTSDSIQCLPDDLEIVDDELLQLATGHEFTKR